MFVTIDIETFEETGRSSSTSTSQTAQCNIFTVHTTTPAKQEFGVNRYHISFL
jgi:hypothetical protein